MAAAQSSPHPDQKYVDGLAQNDPRVILLIYEKFFPMIETYVKQNRGNKEDAEDLFSTALQLLHLKAREGLQIRQSFGALLKLICQRRWINQLKRNQRISLDIENQAEPVENAEVIANMEAQERKVLFRHHFDRLPARCRDILALTLGGKNYREVAEVLELNYSFVRRRGGECINQLIKSIQGDPLFGELK